MSSLFKVPFTKILAINPHTNAERLEVATVYGFQVIVRKDSVKVGDPVIYVPIDSILPANLDAIVFPPESKIKLNNRRVKQIRLRGLASQGLLLSTNDVKTIANPDYFEEEQDLADILGIVKYEPPAPKGPSQPGNKTRNRPLTNPHFREYNGITNIKWAPFQFQDKEVVLQEKLHGSHIRFGKAPFVANTLMKKIKKFFRLTPKHEWVYGSNAVELTNRSNYTGFYGSDIYGAALNKINADKKVKDGEFWHAEIIGPGIQKGYSYGHTEHHVVVFDCRIMNEDGTQKWLDPEVVEEMAKERGFTFVPVLYRGPFNNTILEKETTGPSIYDSNEKIREGCVVKMRHDYDNLQNKQCLKSISPAYLDGDHGDAH